MSRRGLRSMFRLDRFGRRMDDSLEDELRFHLETREAQLRGAGLSPEEARVEARRGFGDPDRVRQECLRIDRSGERRRARGEILADILQDIRLTLRGLSRARGYTFVVLLSLAVGIGVNTAAFTAIDAFWFAPVPGVTGQDGIAEIVVVDRGSEEWGWTYPDFEAVRGAHAPLEALTGWADRDVTLGAYDGGRRVHAAYATSDYFGVFGAGPAAGRGFLPEEDRGAGQHAVAVVSHHLWQEDLQGDPEIIGRTLLVNREPYTVVGVAQEGFRGPRPTMGTTDLWIPLTQHPLVAGDDETLRNRRAFWISVAARLSAGTSSDQVQAAVRTVFGRLAGEYPETNGERTAKVAAYRRFPAQNRAWDMVAVGGVAALLVLVLLVICANLTGMALARSAGREREIAIRLALGSGRSRLARLLMLEATLLAAVGGGVGAAAALLAMRSVSPTALGILAPGIRFEPRTSIILASLALTALAALAVGLIPALRFSRPELVSSLRDDAGGGGRRAGRMQRFASSAQAGVALASLVMGGLFFRSLGALDGAALGFEPEGMIVADYRTGALSSALMDLDGEGYPTLDAGGEDLLNRLHAALASVPGVTAVAFADGVPLDRSRAYTMVSRGDRPDEAEGRLTAEYTRVTEGYVEAIGAALLRGRDLAVTDDATSEPVVLITESLAGRLWPGEEAVGRTLARSAGKEGRLVATVVGVVADVSGSRAGERWPHVFVPMRQEYRGAATIVLRTATSVGSVAEPVRVAIRSVDAALPVPALVKAEAIVQRSTEEQRGAAKMSGALGLMILILSAMGVYGVVALTVAGRTREIGVRMAMGAGRSGVLGTILRDALRLAGPGLAVGALVAGTSALAMRSMLLGVSPVDPTTFLGAGAVLVAVVLLASYIPARRASKIDPMEALRTD
ncbi:MAG TPA: ADOP family duplicated permease [Longimicrobiales bacterium]|nr:ADOP family duplicated permease [Longimicrobiales bacterium]